MRAVNLIPAEQRSSASLGAGRSGGAAYAVLGIVAGLAVMALLYGIAHHQIAGKEGEVAQLNARAQRAQQQAAALASYTSFASMRAQRAKAVEALVDSRFDWAHVMHELGRVLPPGASIASLQGTVGSTATGSTGSATATSASSSSSSSTAAKGAGTATSATPPGSVPTFQVSGCARSHVIVADTLARLRLIDGVSEVTLQSSAKSNTAGGGSAAGAGQSCPPGAASYAATVTFQPLPGNASGTSTATATTVSTGASR